MSHQYCTFEVDDLYCGVEVEQVQEVIRAQPITLVPHARPVVAGLINLRGAIVVAIDLRRRLHLSERPDGVTPMHVVIRNAGDPVSLLVDRIGEVVTVDDATFEAPPDTLDDLTSDLVDGTYKLDDRLLLVLNTAQAIATAPSAPGISELSPIEHRRSYERTPQ